jgi:predicted Zn-dependent protease with MMP-like domain
VKLREAVRSQGRHGLPVVPGSTASEALRRPPGRYRWVMGPADPEDEAFGGLVDAAISNLPAEFLERLDSVAIVVEDEPTPEQLASVDAGGLFGLYQGVPRTRWGADGATFPSKITIFRGPLERAHRDPAALAAAVEDVVRHEVAHHLGIDDRRLGELAREKRR